MVIWKNKIFPPTCFDKFFKRVVIYSISSLTDIAKNIPKNLKGSQKSVMNGLTAEYEFSDGVLTIRLRGEIDHHSVKYVREEIDRQILLLRSRTVHLDMKEVGFMDSSGLGLIMGRYNHTKENGIAFKVVNPCKSAERVLRLAGADKMIDIEYIDK